ncbi:DUF3667 domain-containing protein [Luteimonas sp. e5]
MLEAGHCANCGRAIDGAEQKFCPACGRATPVRRIDWAFLRSELEHSVLHMDRGVLHTLKHLMLRPGHLLREYLDGQRGSHVKPLLLVMMMAAAVLLLNRHFAGGMLLDVDPGTMTGAAGEGAGGLEELQAANIWFRGNFTLITLASIPLMAATSWLVFRRWRDVNYPEWLVIWAFLTAQGYVLWGLLMLVQRWLPDTMVWSLLLMPLYATASLMQFFGPGSRWQVLWRLMVAYGLSFILQIVGSSLAMLFIQLLRPAFAGTAAS